MVDQLDILAEETGKSRQKIIEEAVRQLLEREGELQEQ